MTITILQVTTLNDKDFVPNAKNKKKILYISTFFLQIQRTASAKKRRKVADSLAFWMGARGRGRRGIPRSRNRKPKDATSLIYRCTAKKMNKEPQYSDIALEKSNIILPTENATEIEGKKK